MKFFTSFFYLFERIISAQKITSLVETVDLFVKLEITY